MKKPWFVRLFGWLFWCGVAWIGFVMLCLFSGTAAGLLVLGIWLYAWLTGICLLVWLAGSLVVWHARQKNPTTGYYYPASPVIVQPQSAAAPSAGWANMPFESTWTPAACHVCRTASPVWRCATHGLMLCAHCRPHYQCPPASYGCHWQPVQASQPRTVMTSPLGGLR